MPPTKKVGNSSSTPPVQPENGTGTFLDEASSAVGSAVTAMTDFFESVTSAIKSSPETNTVDITLPQQTLGEIYDWAEKKGISKQKAGEIIYQVMTDSITDPASGKKLTRDEFLKEKYEIFFEGNLGTKIDHWIANEESGQKWFQENKEKIADTFKNRFSASGGMFFISIISLMGASEIADVIGIKDPTLQLAFVLSAVGPINKAASFTNSYFSGMKNFSKTGVFSVSQPEPGIMTFKPLEKFEVVIEKVEGDYAVVGGKGFPLEKAGVPVQNGKVVMMLDGKPVSIEATPGAFRTASSLSVPDGKVTIKIQAGGRGAKYFLNGLINSMIPPGETKLIRAGKSMLGVIKLPLHIYDMFTNMGCGIATQTVWNKTLGSLIPDDFLWGVPKHFFSIAALFAPEITLHLAPQALRPKIAQFTSNPAWKVLGRLLILDIAALGAVSLWNIGQNESAGYQIGLYARSGESVAPWLKKIPDWIPGKSFLSIFFGALCYKEAFRIEKVDRFISSGFRAVMKENFLNLIEPKLSGKKWLDFAKSGGFENPDLSAFKTLGLIRIHNPQAYKQFLNVLQSLTGLSGMPENEMFDEWFETDWITSKKPEDFIKAVQDGKWDDKEFLDPDYNNHLLTWLYIGTSDFRCEELSEEECMSEAGKWAAEKYKGNMTTAFADYWIKKKFKLLNNLYFTNASQNQLNWAKSELSKLGVDINKRRSPMWMYADIAVNNTPALEEKLEINLGDPEATLTIGAQLQGINDKLSENPQMRAQELCLMVLALEKHVVILQKDSEKPFNELQETYPVLDYLIKPTSSGNTENRLTEQMYSWQETPEYFSALSSQVQAEFVKTIFTKRLSSEILAFAEEEVQAASQKSPHHALHVSNISLLYPLIKLAVETNNGAQENNTSISRTANFYATMLLKGKMESILQKTSGNGIMPQAKATINKQITQIEEKVKSAYSKQLGFYFLQYGVNKEAIDNFKKSVETSDLFDDLKLDIYIARSMAEITKEENGILKFIDKDMHHNWDEIIKIIKYKAQQNAAHLKFIRADDALTVQEKHNNSYTISETYGSIWANIISMLIENGSLDAAESFQKRAAADDEFSNDDLSFIAELDVFGKMAEMGPATTVTMREIINNVKSLFYLSPSAIKSSYFDPYKKSYMDYLSEFDTTASVTDPKIENLQAIKLELESMKNAISIHNYDPFANMALSLMNLAFQTLPTSDLLVAKNSVSVEKLLFEVFDDILGGYREPIGSPEVEENPELLEAIYVSNDRVGPVPQDVPNPMNVFYEPGLVDETKELLDDGDDPEKVVFNLAVMKFRLMRASLALKVAELKKRNLLNENEFISAYGALKELKSLEKDLKNGTKHYKQVAAEAKFIIDECKTLSVPPIFDVFDSEGKVRDQKLAYKFAASHGISNLRKNLLPMVTDALMPETLPQNIDYEMIGKMAKWTHKLSAQTIESLPVISVPEDKDEIIASPDKLEDEAAELEMQMIKLSVNGLIFKLTSEGLHDGETFEKKLSDYVDQLYSYQLSGGKSFDADIGPSETAVGPEYETVNETVLTSVAEALAVVEKRHSQIKKHIMETQDCRPETLPAPDFEQFNIDDDLKSPDDSISFDVLAFTGGIKNWEAFKLWLSAATKVKLAKNIKNMEKYISGIKNEEVKELFEKKLAAMKEAYDEIH